MRYLKLFNENKETHLKLFDSYNTDIYINSNILKFGTKNDYINYISTIFPESKYSNVFQHQTNHVFSNFTKEGDGRLGKGYYFSKLGNNYVDDDSFNTKYVLLNIKNPAYIKGGGYMKMVYNISDNRNLNIDDYNIKIKIRDEVESYFRKNYDCIIGDENGNLQEEYKVFYTNQIHILGDSIDIEKFKKYLKND